MQALSAVAHPALAFCVHLAFAAAIPLLTNLLYDVLVSFAAHDLAVPVTHLQGNASPGTCYGPAYTG